MYSLTSSITCIVIGFILNEKFSGLFDETLRRKYKTVLEPISNGGLRVLDPRWQKTSAIKAIRTEMRESAANWFRTQFPGLFASNMEDEFPTCEFVTLRKAHPFPKRGEGDHESEDWLSILDMDHDIDTWLADDPPGLKFTWPLTSDKKSRFHAAIAAREDAFLNKDLQGYGGGGRASYVWYVNYHVSGLLSRWALLCMLSGFERYLNNIRDSATFKPAYRKKPLNLLRELIGHVSQSVDIAAASPELRHFAEKAVFFEHDLQTFKPSDHRFYPDKDITLGKALREQIKGRSIRLQILDRSVRDLLMQYGTVIGARENIKLQNRMGKLTYVMLILTFLMAGFTLLTAYITVKAGNIAWPW